MSRAAPRILITGFGRFPGAPANPAAPIARALAKRRRPALASTARSAMVLPTTWANAADFDATLDRLAPDIVLMVGLAACRPHLCIELRGQNATGTFPDATRTRPPSRLLQKGGPASAPCAAGPAPLLHALRQAGVPARLSRDAGRYVCNALAYRTYQWAAACNKPRMAVFVHIPRPSPHLPSSTITRAIEALLVALVAQFRAASAR